MKILTYIVIIAFLLSLFLYHTDASVSATAIQHARQDALNDVNQNLWICLGGCLPGIAVFGANPIFIEIPVDRLMGRPPEYVLFYMEEYKRKVSDIRLRKITQGSIYAASVVVFFGIVFSLR